MWTGKTVWKTSAERFGRCPGGGPPDDDMGCLHRAFGQAGRCGRAARPS
ncbi:MAG: hypothetical protein MZV70_20530 [Desulfobacterales bacterium]|nr:hypothetical protein [Desulfobacterales bacterium]